MKYRVIIFDQESRLASKTARYKYNIDSTITAARRLANNCNLKNFYIKLVVEIGSVEIPLEVQFKRQDKRRYIIRRNKLAWKTFIGD